MGKKKQTTVNESKSKVVNFYGTKADWVKCELDLTIGDIMCKVFGKIGNSLNEKAVVAEDETGLYVTGKSYVGALVLDPYRMYNRVVPEVITEGENIVYKVNC